MKRAFYILVVAVLLVSFQERREMVVSENQIRKLIDNWNEIQGKGDSAKLVRLYIENDILWNGEPTPLSKIVTDKLAHFTTPILKQDILPKSLMLQGYTARGGLIKCNFTMLRKIDGKVRDIPYYILLVKDAGKLKIMGEGDQALAAQTLLGLSMKLINVDVNDSTEKEAMIVISGRSYFYPMIASAALVILIAAFVFIRKRKATLISSSSESVPK